MDHRKSKGDFDALVGLIFFPRLSENEDSGVVTLVDIL